MMLRRKKTQRDKLFDILAQNPQGLTVLDILEKCQKSGDTTISHIVTGALRRCLQELLASKKIYKHPSGDFDIYGRSIPVWYPATVSSNSKF